MRARSSLTGRKPRALGRLRARDAASASTVSLVIGLAVFMISTGVLAAFALQPASVAKPSDALLRARADDVLQVLARSPGVPADWGRSAAAIDSVQRVGLLEANLKRTVNESKFYALWRGASTAAGPAGTVDYAELRKGLGLGVDGSASSYHLHVSASPILPIEAYGTSGMSAHRVAYIGDFVGGVEQTSSASESATIDALDVAFTKVTCAGFTDCDRYRDDNAAVHDYLVPRLGTKMKSVERVGGGALPDHVWIRFPSSTFEAAGYGKVKEGSYAAAIANDGFGYQTSVDFRTVIGSADFSAWTTGLAPRASWWEIVEGEGENLTSGTDKHIDYGVIEAWDGGSWIELNPATSSPAATRNPSVSTVKDASAPGLTNPTAWERHTVDFGACTNCKGRQSVPIALRWRDDGGSTKGVGWFVDDFKVQLAGGNGETVLHETFEAAYYQTIVVGSNVAQSTMAAGPVKYGLRDFVKAGGTLIVLGGQTNVNWLNPFLSASITANAAPNPTVTDASNPFLTTPNTLNYQAWSPNGYAWTYTGSDFVNVVRGDVNAATQHVLAVSVDDPSWGGSGRVILTSYYPYQMASSDSATFLANSIVYGKYGHLYMEVGPTVPRGTSVASASAVGLIDSLRVGTGETVEVRFTVFVWK